MLDTGFWILNAGKLSLRQAQDRLLSEAKKYHLRVQAETFNSSNHLNWRWWASPDLSTPFSRSLASAIAIDVCFFRQQETQEANPSILAGLIQAHNG